MDAGRVPDLHQRRTSRSLRARLRRWLEPPAPYVMNPREGDIDAPLGRWNLYIGGAGSEVEGYVNVDLFALPGVDVVADAEHLPFADSTFQRVECDAVLEHVRQPYEVMAEIRRVLRPGAFAHVVTPFCHPFHEYPRDYRRFTIDGLEELARPLSVVARGWRTGPTATMLVFILEYVKLWSRQRWWRMLAHGVLGWLLFPLRYLDLLFFARPECGRIGNHCYVWLQKRDSENKLQ